MAVFGVLAPRYTRWFTTPHRENTPRAQCPACRGGGTINGVGCGGCDGSGHAEDDDPTAAATRRRK